MSGAPIAGGEKRLLTENEKALVTYVPVIEVRVKVIEAVATLPTQLPELTVPERGAQVKVEPRGRLFDVEISCDHWSVEGKDICT